RPARSSKRSLGSIARWTAWSPRRRRRRDGSGPESSSGAARPASNPGRFSCVRFRIHPRRGGHDVNNGKRIVKRAVLAYSGGLDTSIIVHWIKEHYRCEVVCYCSDVGQGAELDGLEARARALGASEVVVEDLRLPFVRYFCLPAMRASAVYASRHLHGN